MFTQLLLALSKLDIFHDFYRLRFVLNSTFQIFCPDLDPYCLQCLPGDDTSRQRYSKTCVKRPLSKKTENWLSIPIQKRQKIGYQYQLSLNAGQRYCRMLQGEHSAILSIFIKLPFVIKILVFSIFEWPFYSGFSFIVKVYLVCGK